MYNNIKVIRQKRPTTSAMLMIWISKLHRLDSHTPHRDHHPIAHYHYVILIRQKLAVNHQHRVLIIARKITTVIVLLVVYAHFWNHVISQVVVRQTHQYALLIRVVYRSQSVYHFLGQIYVHLHVSWVEWIFSLTIRFCLLESQNSDIKPKEYL